MGYLDTLSEIESSPRQKQKLPPEFEENYENYYSWSICIILEVLAFFYFNFYLIPCGYISLSIWISLTVYGNLAGVGTTIGAHRLWSHKSYKATLPLRIWAMLWHTATFTNSLFRWVREHRVHHKYMDTDADPHNATRGFWFSHCGWLMSPKHPECLEKLETIEVSDLIADPVIRFQSKYYKELTLVMCFLIPMALCHYLDPTMSLFHLLVSCFTMHAVVSNFVFCVNSVAVWGDKPYDIHISPANNWKLAIFTAGEGWHNYHHTFPWDYKVGEYPWKANTGALFIEFFAKIGWAYDLKTVSPKLLNDRRSRTGDKSLEYKQTHNNNVKANGTKENNIIGLINKADIDKVLRSCWGWDDVQRHIKCLEKVVDDPCAQCD